VNESLLRVATQGEGDVEWADEQFSSLGFTARQYNVEGLRRAFAQRCRVVRQLPDVSTNVYAGTPVA
jgi:hypothetical protein